MDTTLPFYMDGLYGYAMVLTGDAIAAAELVQETYLRATEPMGALREDNVKACLYTILRDIRPRLLAGENTAGLGIETAQDPHAVDVRKVEVEQVREAILRLPLEFREVILLREYAELSYQEIATLLDCPPGAVLSRLARARSKLRILLPPAARSSPSPSVRPGGPF
jgi:RNA polymerase sigma-70 factor, ECF subfamily